MLRRGLSLNRVFALTVLLISIGIDIRAIRAAGPLFTAPYPASTVFPLPGPRRYPPGYHAGTNHDAVGIRPDAAGLTPGRVYALG